MKILTFQHKNIIRDIQSKGLYITQIDSEYKKMTPRCYDIVFDSIPDKEDGSSKPIFGWQRVSIGDLNEINVDEKTIKRCLEMVPMDLSTHLLFELDIPKERVSLQNFYNFVDARCEEEGFDKYYKTFDEFPIHVIFQLDAGENQCTFSSISFMHIIKLFHKRKNKINYSYHKCYSGYY